MLDTEKIKYEQLIENLKTIASMRHCYEENDYYDYPPHTWAIFEDGEMYGTITTARSALKFIGEEFEGQGG